VEEVLAAIARKHLSVPTLDARSSDRLDFHECSVWALREALTAAYQAGATEAEARGAPSEWTSRAASSA
jgi:hypothetical protein